MLDFLARSDANLLMVTVAEDPIPSLEDMTNRVNVPCMLKIGHSSLILPPFLQFMPTIA